MKAITLPLIITGALVAAIFNPVQKTKTLSDDSKLTYNINDNNKLEGAYFIENTDKNVWIRGSYKNDERSGNWYGFNNNKTVFIRYNYDLKKLLYIDTVAIKKIELTIVSKDPEAVKNAPAPLPICSIDQIVSLLGERAKAAYPKDMIVYNKPTDVDIVARVKSADDVKYYVNYSIRGNNYSAEINTKNLDFDIDWIPSTYNGKVVEAEFKIPTQLIFSADASRRQRFTWNY